MSKARYVLAIDQGTTGTHATLLDGKLNVKGRAYREFPQHFPKPGWVEHRLEQIWASVLACIRGVLQGAQVSGKSVAAIGITNQRETTALWNRKDGRPAANAIVWQDRRTSDVCAELKARGKEPRVQELTGLVLDPYFSATKIAWLLEHKPGLRQKAESGELCFGTLDSFLVFKLTAGQAHVTDVSNASRTLLLGLKSLAWEPELLAMFGVPNAILPTVVGSAERYGVTSGVAGLPDGIPICGMAGDQQAALFGQGCLAAGDSKCTYGTGAFLLMNTGSEPVMSQRGLLTTVAWRIGEDVQYALEGSAFIAGAAVQWLRDGLGLIAKSADVEQLARKVKDSGDIVFVPALSGLGAPRWRPEARGLLLGMDRGTTKAHVARATLEGIAFQVYELAEAMRQESGYAIHAFKVDGGATANRLLMQFQADLLDVPVIRPANLETTGLGAALLAGIGAGLWDTTHVVRSLQKRSTTFSAKMTATERGRHLAKWRRAVERA